MNYLAFDLGGSSGKLFLGTCANDQLNITCIHQFENHPVSIGEGLYWDFIHIYDELCKGLKKAVSCTGDSIDFIGFDSFCNDFALIDERGNLLTPIRCYRDSRTGRCQEHTYSIMSPEELYQVNGNQNALFNTLLQLDAMKTEGFDWLLNNCHKALFVSDLFIYLLTGKMVTEYTTASVTQMFDFDTADWSEKILKKYQIQKSLFAPVTMPGTIVGKTTDAFNRLLNTRGFSVSTVCQHDTASAFLASIGHDSYAIISCGTWCLVGTEISSPVITEEGFRCNIANEGGFRYVDTPGKDIAAASRTGHHRLLRNVMGTWIIQEIARELRESGKEISYSRLDEGAARHPVTDFFIDVDRQEFYQPGNMMEKVTAFCREHYGKAPSSVEEMISCVYVSLAFKYRYTIEKLEELTGKTLATINMVGGGSQSSLMCQITADICGRTVFSGPADATALGNILVQMKAAGEIASIEEGRELIRNSISISTFKPRHEINWEQAYQEFISRFYTL